MKFQHVGNSKCSKRAGPALQGAGTPQGMKNQLILTVPSAIQWLSYLNQSPWPVGRFPFPSPFPGFYLFNVEEVLGIEGDGSAWDRNIFIQSPTVTHVGLDSKCYWFGLQTGKKTIKNTGNFSSIKMQP